MKPLSTELTDYRSILKALRALSSDDLLRLNEEAELLAMERFDEEEIERVKAK